MPSPVAAFHEGQEVEEFFLTEGVGEAREHLRGEGNGAGFAARDFAGGTGFYGIHFQGERGAVVAEDAAGDDFA